MILGGDAIYDAIMDGAWKTNADVRAITSNSIDVRLDKKIQVTGMNGYVEKELPYRLYPRDFILGCTKEYFDCTAPLYIHGRKRRFVAMYEGRSTIARMGLITHLSAGFGDYGFAAPFTLEIVNLSPWSIVLEEGMRIGQIAFMEVVEPRLYIGRYKDQVGPTPPATNNID